MEVPEPQPEERLTLWEFYRRTELKAETDEEVPYGDTTIVPEPAD